MTNWLKFVIALAAAVVLMLAFRALAFVVYSVEGNDLSPLYISGDRVLVNRWSYGYRVSGDGLLPYSRLLRQPVDKGDVVAFSVAIDGEEGVVIARCKAVPGDTLQMERGATVVPGLATCADADYYWFESINPRNPVDSRSLGFISERDIIGRVIAVLYSHDDRKSLLEGYRKERFWR